VPEVGFAAPAGRGCVGAVSLTAGTVREADGRGVLDADSGFAAGVLTLAGGDGFPAAPGAGGAPGVARSWAAIASSTVLRLVFTLAPSLRRRAMTSTTLRSSSLASCPTRIFAI
jgi:hypothetical protein